MISDSLLKIAAALTSEPIEIVVVATGDKTVAARVRTVAGVILHEGTGSTSDDAVADLQKVVEAAASAEAESLDARAAALRDALK